ncbi:MAG: hypothetical protein GY805_32590 [Chloroflexi bacterium]|nr:hypothetical protein [Chloroflexota bacterium]
MDLNGVGKTAVCYDKIVEAMGGHGEFAETAVGSRKPACVNVSLDKEGMMKTSASAIYCVGGSGMVLLFADGEWKRPFWLFIMNACIIRLREKLAPLLAAGLQQP